MKVLHFNPGEPDSHLIQEAADILLAGGVAIIPTDTVYGLAASPQHPGALESLYRIKSRPLDKPLPLLVDSLERASALGIQVPAAAGHLAQRFWPGPLTMVLPTVKGSEGLRMPDDPVTLALLSACHGSLRVTSANRSGQREALSAEAAMETLGSEVDLVIDCGPSRGGRASTVVSFLDENLAVLREGAISRDCLLESLAEGGK